MSRPRVAGIVSGIAASVAAFLVVSRWNLAGTLTGAAIMPVIYILISHCTLEGIDGLSGWTQRRLGGDAGPASESETDLPSTMESAAPEPRMPRRGHTRAQWVLVGVASLSLIVSLCSVVLRAPAAETILRETVVKTVTVTSESAPAVALQSVDNTAETTTAGEAGPEGTDVTPGTTADTTVDPGADQPDAGAESASTTSSNSSTTSTTTPASAAEGDASSPTTSAVATSPASLP